MEKLEQEIEPMIVINEKFKSKQMEIFFNELLHEQEELWEYVEENYINVYLDLYYLYCKVLSDNYQTESILNILYSL